MTKEKERRCLTQVVYVVLVIPQVPHVFVQRETVSPKEEVFGAASLLSECMGRTEGRIYCLYSA